VVPAHTGRLGDIAVGDRGGGEGSLGDPLTTGVVRH
jgi:hypothetical protein